MVCPPVRALVPGASLKGPWTFATPDLPAAFRAIPEGAPYYAVRASVPGTSESAEARLKASIPTTARVEVGSIKPDVAYVGSPQFAPIEGTALGFATNTTATVIKVGSATSCCRTVSGSSRTRRMALGTWREKCPLRL